MAYILWLIEHPQQHQGIFYFGWEEGEKNWTADINAALKFDTKAEAEAMAINIGLPDYRIVDHQWLDHKPATNLDVA